MALSDKDPSMMMRAEEKQVRGFDCHDDGTSASIYATAARRGR